jgi:hypothetical protein
MFVPPCRALFRALATVPRPSPKLAPRRVAAPGASAAEPANAGEAVASFSDLKRLLRRVVLRVHPDVMAGAGLSAERSRVNEASLQALFRLFDGLRVRLGEGGPVSEGGGAALPAQPSPVAGTHAFAFWHEARRPARGGVVAAAAVADAAAAATAYEGEGGDRDEGLRAAARGAPLLALFRREFDVPASVEARAAELARGGYAAAVHAQWLALGADVLRLLGEGMGLFPRGAVQLAPAARAALRAEAGGGGAEEGEGGVSSAPSPREGAARRRARADPWAFATADAAIRGNLLSLSPLQQGKGGAPGPPTLAEARALVAGAPRSIFSAASVARRVDALLGGAGFSAEAACGAVAVARLRAALRAHHDALHLYHEAWPSVRLTLRGAGGGWAADAAARALAVPADFSDVELVHFVRRSWPALQARAVAEALHAAAAQQRAQGAAAKREAKRAREKRALDEEAAAAAAYYK